MCSEAELLSLRRRGWRWLREPWPASWPTRTGDTTRLPARVEPVEDARQLGISRTIARFSLVANENDAELPPFPLLLLCFPPGGSSGLKEEV